MSSLIIKICFNNIRLESKETKNKTFELTLRIINESLFGKFQFIFLIFTQYPCKAE